MAKKKGIDGINGQIIVYVVMAVVVLLAVLPLYVSIISSLKSNADFLNSMFSLPTKLSFRNWSSSFVAILPNLLNSLIISSVSTFFVVGIGSVAAYVFVRLNFIGQKFLFQFLILLLLIPSIITLPPLYLLCVQLRLDNTWFAIWFPTIAGGQVSAMFLFTTFFRQQPKEIFEAAQIDGASHCKMFFCLALPLGIPVLCIQAVGTFAQCYNDFLWPTIVIQQTDKQPLMPVLRNLAKIAEVDVGLGAPYAMYLLSGIPLIVTTLIGLKYFINGEFASGLKI